MKNIVLDNVMNMAHDLAELEVESDAYKGENKKQIWVKMGNELESQNVPKNEIHSLLHKILESELQKVRNDPKFTLYKGGWYFEVSKKNGWLKGYDRNQENSSHSEEKKLAGGWVKEREQFIKFHRDIIEQADKNIKLLESDTIIVTKKGKEIKEEIDWKDFFESPELFSKSFKELRDMFYSDRPEWVRQRDSRQSLLPKMRMTMVALTSVATNKWVCSRWFADVVKLTAITPKKLTMYMRDILSENDMFLNVGDDGWLMNFLDIPCPECGKLRLKVKNLEDGTWVIICKNWLYHKNKEKVFPPTLFRDTIKALALDGSEHLKRKGIKIPDN